MEAQKRGPQHPLKHLGQLLQGSFVGAPSFTLLSIYRILDTVLRARCGMMRRTSQIPLFLKGLPNPSWIFLLALCGSWPLLSVSLASLVQLVWVGLPHPPSKGLLTHRESMFIFCPWNCSELWYLHNAFLVFHYFLELRACFCIYIPCGGPVPSDPLHKKSYRVCSGPFRATSVSCHVTKAVEDQVQAGRITSGLNPKEAFPPLSRGVSPTPLPVSLHC